MGKGYKGTSRGRPARAIKNPDAIRAAQQNKSKLSTTFLLRPFAEEKCRIVTDTDWEELSNNVDELDSFKKEYSEWSRSFYSVAVSFLIFFVTLCIDPVDDVFNPWYYSFLVIAVVAGIVGMALNIKAVQEKEKVASTKKNIQNVLQRIEKKSSEVNFDYNPSDGEYPL